MTHTNADTPSVRAEMPVPAAVPVIYYRTATVDGVSIFYREAGPADAPVVLLLHGFPTSSHMFRNLIPLLADRYRVIAPDYPGFGAERRAGSHAVRLHLRPLRRPDGWSSAAARRPTLRYVRDGLRRTGRLPPGAQAPGAGQRADRPERQCLRRRPQGVLGPDQGLLGGRLGGQPRGARLPGGTRTRP